MMQSMAMKSPTTVRRELPCVAVKTREHRVARTPIELTRPVRCILMLL
jgi:hypothetical protein